MTLGKHSCEPQRLGAGGSGGGRRNMRKWGTLFRGLLWGSKQQGIPGNVLMTQQYSRKKLRLVLGIPGVPIPFAVPKALAAKIGT
eukprot:10924749-Heterocapsa_arctica.AAC.1